MEKYVGLWPGPYFGIFCPWAQGNFAPPPPFVLIQLGVAKKQHKTDKRQSIIVCLKAKVTQTTNYRIFRPIARALSIQKRFEIVKNEHAWYTLERFSTDNERVICTKKGFGKYGIMY
jgi:tartrate dehydratase alpha subunit/fumarate hydratase class I-like protein